MHEEKIQVLFIQYFVFAVLIFQVNSSARADPADAVCIPLYQQTGAVPHTSECPLLAATANIGLGTFYCTAEPERIERYCGKVEKTCPVKPLLPIPDSAAKYETGIYSEKPNLTDLSSATLNGLQCIVQEVQGLGRRRVASATSGYRPPEYQKHIREIYDKWALLKNNKTAECKKVKADVEAEYNRHGPFAHQPGATSLHSSGSAVDISGVPADHADKIAYRCKMSRPVPNDPVHYEPVK